MTIYAQLGRISAEIGDFRIGRASRVTHRFSFGNSPAGKIAPSDGQPFYSVGRRLFFEVPSPFISKKSGQHERLLYSYLQEDHGLVGRLLQTSDDSVFLVPRSALPLSLKSRMFPLPHFWDLKSLFRVVALCGIAKKGNQNIDGITHDMVREDFSSAENFAALVLHTSYDARELMAVNCYQGRWLTDLELESPIIRLLGRRKIDVQLGMLNDIHTASTTKRNRFAKDPMSLSEIAREFAANIYLKSYYDARVSYLKGELLENKSTPIISEEESAADDEVAVSKKTQRVVEQGVILQMQLSEAEEGLQKVEKALLAFHLSTDEPELIRLLNDITNWQKECKRET